MPKSVRFLIQCTIFLLIFSVSAQAQEFEQTKLSILKQNGQTVLLDAELALTEKQRLKGWMYRSHMPEDSCMLFDFGYEQDMNMWMKNTPISLDMLFADKNGVIFQIEQDTRPFSTSTIFSEQPGRYVVEAPAGLAVRHNITIGDRIIIPEQVLEQGNTKSKKN